MMKPVFVYGTLCSPAVVETLLGRPFPTKFARARLDDHSRHPVKGQVFPATIHNPQNHVEGYLLQNLTPKDLELLDWFESDEYDRQVVQVCVNPSAKDGSNELVEALVYIWQPHLMEELELDAEWSFENFEKEHLDWYLKHTVRPCRQDMEERGMTKAEK
eukprot:scaffold543_cov119-Cylindrotheca_fusiformis.AAC.31